MVAPPTLTQVFNNSKNNNSDVVSNQAQLTYPYVPFHISQNIVTHVEAA